VKDKSPDMDLYINALYKTSSWNVKASGKRTLSGDFEGKLRPKVIIPYSMNLSFKFRTSNKYNIKLKKKDLLLPGFTLYLTGKQDPYQHAVEGGVDYKHKFGSINLLLKYPFNDSEKSFKVLGSGVFVNGGLSAGGKFMFSEEMGVNRWGVKVDYKKDQRVNASFYMDYKLKDEESEIKWGVGVRNKIRDNLEGAVDFSVIKNVPRIRIGYQYDVDKTCSCKVRTIIGDEVKIGLALQQKVTSFMSLSMSSDFNTKRILGANDGDNHRFSLGFCFFE